ncbi:MAG: hypothetical protein RLZZ347_719 [Candidatus Parcubacteria bacterium]|jgi:hypothetical protein
MTASVLDKEVILRGKDFWGRRATLLLSPNPNSLAWTLDTTDDRQLVIKPQHASTEKPRIVLQIDDTQVHVPEHILATRFSNVLGVSIGSSVWPPYHGRAMEVLMPLIQSSHTLQTDFPTYMVPREVYFEYREKRGPETAFTSITPSEDGKLTLKIVCDYKGLGRWERIYVLPDIKLLMKICGAHAQGWPPYLYRLSKAGKMLRFWPHHDQVTWIQEHSADEARELFSLHRAQDLLGALALLCRDGTFVGRVCSYYSGHKADIEVVKQADQILMQIQ